MFFKPASRHGLAQQMMGLSSPESDALARARYGSGTGPVTEVLPTKTVVNPFVNSLHTIKPNYANTTAGNALLTDAQRRQAEAGARPTAVAAYPLVLGFVTEAETYAASAAGSLAAAEDAYKNPKKYSYKGDQQVIALKRLQAAIDLVGPLVAEKVEKATTLAAAALGDGSSFSALMTRARAASNSTGFASNRVSELIGLAASASSVDPMTGGDVKVEEFTTATPSVPVWAYAAAGVVGVLVIGGALFATKKKKAV